MPNLKSTVVGFAVGIVAAATIAWGLEVKIPPKITAKANLVVDEIGNVLFGSTPGNVTVTNLPAVQQVQVTNFPPATGGTASAVLKDANGTTIGLVEPGSPPSGTIFVSRDVGGVAVEIAAPTQFNLDASLIHRNAGEDLYFASNNCSDTPHLFVGEGHFYAPTILIGGALYYPAGAPAVTTFHSIQPIDPAYGSCISSTFQLAPSQALVLANLDLGQFVPPFHIE